MIGPAARPGPRRGGAGACYERRARRGQRLPWSHHAAMGETSGGNSNGSEMLVLTRKTNQSIMIGDDVEVTVLAVSRDKIRLGITAPRDVPVFRKEVYLSIQGEAGAESDGDGEAQTALDALKGDG